MISESHKFLYIDIVKTGGTSFNKILEPFGGKGKHHSIARELPNLGVNDELDSPVSRESVENYFKFTIVRNPYDRLVSLFSYCQTAPLQVNFQKSGWEGIWGRPVKRLPRKCVDRKTYWPTQFEEFVVWLVNYQDYYCDWTLEKYITMAEWVQDDSGIMQLDYLGKFETLQHDVTVILSKLGIPSVQLPKLNVSQETFKTMAIQELTRNRRIREIIVGYYKGDFEMFDYPADLPAEWSNSFILQSVELRRP